MVWKDIAFIVYKPVYSIQSNSFYIMVILTLPRFAFTGFYMIFSWLFHITRSSRPKVFLWKCILKNYRRTPMPKSDFNKVAKELYWNHTSAWLFSCKICYIFSEYLFIRPPMEGFVYITKPILWIVLDSYVSAIERYRTIKYCLHWDWYKNSCVKEEKKIIQEPSVVYSYIGAKDIRYATGCYCHYGHCDHVDFCAKIKYRRSVDMWSCHRDPSKLAVCAKNFHPWEYHYNWSPKGTCNEYNTKVLWNYELASEWRNFTYRFQADCSNLQVIYIILNLCHFFHGILLGLRI